MDYWTKSGIKKPQQIVVCAANRAKTLIGDVILCGARHFDSVMRNQADTMAITMQGNEQGFIDQFGNFLTREEAMNIVKGNNQHFDFERNGGQDRILYSEGLY